MKITTESYNVYLYILTSYWAWFKLFKWCVIGFGGGDVGIYYGRIWKGKIQEFGVTQTVLYCLQNIMNNLWSVLLK